MMVKVKYLGPGSKVIAGKHVFHGETYEVNEKLVSALRGDPDVEFLDDGPLTIDDGPSHGDAAQLTLDDGPADVPEAPQEVVAPQPVKPVKKAKVVAEPSPVKRTRGRKK